MVIKPIFFGNRTGRHVLWFENINIEENGYFSKEFTALDVLNPVDWVFFDCGNEVSVLDITSQQDTISISGTSWIKVRFSSQLNGKCILSLKT